MYFSGAISGFRYSPHLRSGSDKPLNPVRGGSFQWPQVFPPDAGHAPPFICKMEIPESTGKGLLKDDILPNSIMFITLKKT